MQVCLLPQHFYCLSTWWQSRSQPFTFHVLILLSILIGIAFGWWPYLFMFYKVHNGEYGGMLCASAIIQTRWQNHQIGLWDHRG